MCRKLWLILIGLAFYFVLQLGQSVSFLELIQSQGFTLLNAHQVHKLGVLTALFDH
jgi:hypothetical protein